MFDFLLPYQEEIAENPVFAFEIKRLGWPRTISELRKYLYIVSCGIVISALGWRVLEYMHNDFIDIPDSMKYGLVVDLFYLSLGFSVLVNFYAGITTIGFIQQQIESGHWESLQTTPQTNENIIAAYDAIAQIRPWRLTVVEIGIRLALGIVFFLKVLGDFKDSGIACFLFQIPLVILAAYALEPVLRMRVLVALGIANTLLIRHFVSVVLATLAIVLLLHLLQFAVLGGLWYIIYSAPQDLSAVISWICYLPIGCLLAVVGVYFLYRNLREMALNYALKPRGV
jgi:hypothetical protein